MNIKKRVLCVDDDFMSQKILKALLSAGGVDVVIAENGESALELVNKEAIDLIFMDALMPGISGFEACKILKSTEQHKHIPVIMLTGLSSSDSERMSKEAGADGWLEKPIDKKRLTEKLDTHLKKELR
ncbi:MAG: response regulator [Nitrospirae bacterium]|nr:response regulator [Nitrospirota bacterium]